MWILEIMLVKNLMILFLGGGVEKMLLFYIIYENGENFCLK